MFILQFEAGLNAIEVKMTLEEIRTAVRNILKEWEEDAGTLLPSNDTILDSYINWATEDVVIDLIPFMPEVFLSSEDVSLIDGTKGYLLSAEWLRIHCVQKNVSGSAPEVIEYINVDQRQEKEDVDEEDEMPEGWYLEGDQINFTPTPSISDGYGQASIKVWIIRPEVASMASGGPTRIPRIAHKLIVLRTAGLIAKMNESEAIQPILALYKLELDMVVKIYSKRVHYLSKEIPLIKEV